MEFKEGDKVALRSTPDVLHGAISRVWSGLCRVEGDLARFCDGTRQRREKHDTDYVPYVELGPKKFWMPIKLQANGQYNDLTLEQATAIAQEQAEKSGAVYIVVEAVARVERPVPPVTITKLV